MDRFLLTSHFYHHFFHSALPTFVFISFIMPFPLLFSFLSFCLSHFYLNFSYYAQPKDTPLRLLVFIQIFALLHGLKKDSTKVPIQMHIYPSTCPFFYSSNFLLFDINPQYQPLIESIPNKDILFAIV